LILLVVKVQVLRNCRGFRYRSYTVIRQTKEDCLVQNSSIWFLLILNLKDLPPYLENIKRWVLIGLSIGQRISDLQKIRKENIRYDKKGNALIDIIQVKGNKLLTVPVNNQIIIGILKHKLPYPISEQKFNYYMKEV